MFRFVCLISSSPCQALTQPLVRHYGDKVETFAGTESDVIYPVMQGFVEKFLASR